MKTFFVRLLLLVSAIQFTPLALLAQVPERPRVFYCDPINGKTPTRANDTSAGDGSSKRPWGSLSSVFQAQLFNAVTPKPGGIQSGDIIRLRSGNHGKVSLWGEAFAATEETVIVGDAGHVPVISQVTGGTNVKNWTFRNITILSPDTELKWHIPFHLKGSDAGNPPENITVERCEFVHESDSRRWTDADWQRKTPFYGLYIHGKNIKVLNNHFHTHENCMYVGGNGVLVRGNHLEHFINDGVDFSGSNIEISHNRIVDLYHLASNEFHHDGIQGWNLDGGVFENIFIHHNFIARATGKYSAIGAESDAVFQGIVIFDGRFNKVKIFKNIVKASAFHAITIYRGSDVEITNNTIVSQGPSSVQSWIGIFLPPNDVKDNKVVIRNNISPRFNIGFAGTIFTGNFSFFPVASPLKTTLVDPESTFVRYDVKNIDYDLRVREDSPAYGQNRDSNAGAILD